MKTIIKLIFFILIPNLLFAQNYHFKSYYSASRLANFYSGIKVISDNNNNSFVIGFYKDSLTIKNHLILGGVTKNSNYQVMFIAKLNSNDSLLWVKNILKDSLNGKDDFIATTDKSGNLYLSHYLNNSLKVLNQTYYSIGGYDGLIFKFDANGNLVNSKSIAAKYDEGIADLKVDANNNLIVAGSFGTYCPSSNIDTVDFGGIILSSGCTNLFLAKYDSNFNLIWVKKTGDNSTEIFPTNLSIDKNENLYVTGNYPGSPSNLYFDTFHVSMPFTVNWGCFVSKFNSNGKFAWCKFINTNCWSDHIDISNTINTKDNFIITGQYQCCTNVTFYGSTSLPANLSTSCSISGGYGNQTFMASYDSTGKLLWAHNPNTLKKDNFGDQLGGLTASYLSNDFYFSSLYHDSTFSDWNLVYGNYNWSTLLEKYDSSGTATWYLPLTGNSSFGSDYLDIAPNSDLLMAGCSYSDTFKCENTSFLLAKETPSLFVIRFSNSFNNGIQQIDNDNKNSLELIPNPTVSQIRFKCKNDDNYWFYIYNALGQQMLKTTNKIVQVDEFQKGIYFVKAVNESSGETFSAKFIKQ